MQLLLHWEVTPSSPSSSFLSWLSLCMSLGPSSLLCPLPGRCGGHVSCCAALCVCVCVTNIRSEHLLVLFLLSPLHPPLSVCQNTNGPFLGPCHLVSIHVTLVTTSLLDLCA